MFVFGPSLLFVGSSFDILTTVASASLGVVALSSGMTGWMGKELRMWQRLLLLAGALLLIKPGLTTDLIGLGFLIFVYLVQRLGRAAAKS